MFCKKIKSNFRRKMGLVFSQPIFAVFSLLIFIYMCMHFKIYKHVYQLLESNSLKTYICLSMNYNNDNMTHFTYGLLISNIGINKINRLI